MPMSDIAEKIRILSFSTGDKAATPIVLPLDIRCSSGAVITTSGTDWIATVIWRGLLGEG